jgi:PEP-CTERM motif
LQFYLKERNLNKQTILVAALAFAAISGTASAVVITATDVTSSWHDTVGDAGANIRENVSFGRGNTGDTGDGEGFNQARWGRPTGSATPGRSGLGFRSNAPVSGIVIDTPFDLGDLRHYNWTISRGSVATQSQLDISATLNIDGSSQGPFTFTSALNIDETPNSGTCPYPSDTPCSDRITFENVAGSDTFNIGGVEYTLSILGFGATSATLEEFFISQEGGTRETNLWAQITRADPTPTPEPAPLALLALGLVGLGWFSRRKQ